jgi:hypothetical protein
VIELCAGLRAKLLIGSAWGVSLVFALPAIIFSHVGPSRDGTLQCRLKLLQQSHWQVSE